MPDTSLFLGVELTQRQLLLLLQDANARIHGSVTRSYAKSDSRLRDPLDWWRAFRTGAKDLLRRTGTAPTEIRGIGLTGPDTGPAAAFLDDKAKVLCQVPVEASENQEAVAAFARQVGPRNLTNLTGQQANPHCLAVQTLRLRQEHKKVWNDIHCVLLPRDYLRFRLTGTCITDASHAGPTLLFNPRTRSWSKQLLKLLELDPAWFPEVSNGPLLSGRVTAKAAKETGLAEGTSVAVGGNRSTSMACACGVQHAGEALLELGADGSLAVVDERPLKTDHNRLLPNCHCLVERWTLGLTGATGSDPFDWFGCMFAPTEIQQWRREGREPIEVFAETAASVRPDADVPHYLPVISRTHPGAFSGLRRHHDRPHLLRAMFDGGGLCIRHLLDQCNADLPAIERICITGSGASLPFWRQVMADTLGRSIEYRELPAPAAQGAALLASVAAGIYEDLPAALAAADFHPAVCTPDPESQALYENNLAHYAELTQ